MLKISDILKKAKKNRQKKETAAQKINEPSAKSMPSTQPQAQKSEIKPKAENTQSESGIKQQIPVESEKNNYHTIYKEEDKAVYTESAQAIDAYEKAVSFVIGMVNRFDIGTESSFKVAEDIVDQLIGLLKEDANQLLRLFFAEYSFAKGYIYQHSVNVCILCLKLAIVLDYDETRLKQIGLAALVHDIGLISHDNLISRPTRFNDNDYLEIRKHPIEGKDILRNIAGDLNFEIFDVIHQEHERIDGTGYPYGLKDKEICEYARLIGLVDVYEAIIHDRPYRKKMMQINVIKEILREKNKFEPKFIKTLIDSVGIFALLTVVKLNTKEIAEVVSQNQKMPLRPVIKVTHGAHGQKLSQEKLIDLSKNFSVYILDIYNDINLK